MHCLFIVGCRRFSVVVGVVGAVVVSVLGFVDVVVVFVVVVCCCSRHYRCLCLSVVLY